MVLQLLFEQVRQMWLARGACVKLMNRQRDVNAAVRKYKTADKEFGTALLEMKTDSAALGVIAGFDYLSGFMSLQTLCYMEVQYRWQCVNMSNIFKDYTQQALILGAAGPSNATLRNDTKRKHPCCASEDMCRLGYT